jgi:hypothetical protein
LAAVRKTPEEAKMKLFAQLVLAAVIAAPAVSFAADGDEAPATETKTVDKVEHTHKAGKHTMKHTKKVEKKTDDAAPATPAADEPKM